MKTLPILPVLILCIPLLAYGQADCDKVNMPEDPVAKKNTENHLARFSDLIGEEKYAAAVPHHQWLMANQPQLNKIIYVNGAKMFNALIESAADDSQKMIYVDSLMLTYDMRIQHCNNEAEVSARKAYDSYRHTIRNTDRLETNLELFDRAFELGGQDIPTYMILPYMNVVRYNYSIKKNLSEEQLTERYNHVTSILQNREGQEGIDRILVAVENMYIDEVLGEIPDCATIKDKLGPRFEKDPSNEKVVRLLFSLLTRAKCTSDPLWLETGEAFVKLDPRYSTYMTLASVALSNGDVGRAQSLMNSGLQYAESPEDKSAAYLRLGAIETEKGNYSDARAFYRKALGADPGNKDAYNAIGNLYMRSFDRCKEEKNKVNDRLIYLAAYDKFVAGGNMEMAQQAKEQFPSKVEVFEQNMDVGTEKNTGCWVNETVVLRTRD